MALQRLRLFVILIVTDYKSEPQRLKPHYATTLSARLKSCPSPFFLYLSEHSHGESREHERDARVYIYGPTIGGEGGPPLFSLSSGFASALMEGGSTITGSVAGAEGPSPP